MNPQNFSDYIVYVDESGDHGLASIDKNYPVFVLAFCIFKKEAYRRNCAPAVQRLKFKYFGHDMVIFHEREIRKALPPFQFLVNPSRREEFMGDITCLIRESDFTVIATAIHKERLDAQYGFPDSPYDLALRFCLERLQYFLTENGEGGRMVHVVFERRGKREDEALELEFRRVCDGANKTNQVKLPFTPIFALKSANSCGLQIADLIARPIGKYILDPDEPNRAHDVIRGKYRQSRGNKRGRGLKIFP